MPLFLRQQQVLLMQNATTTTPSGATHHGEQDEWSSYRKLETESIHELSAACTETTSETKPEPKLDSSTDPMMQNAIIHHMKQQCLTIPLNEEMPTNRYEKCN